MKLAATYDSRSQVVELTYDTEAQSVFRQWTDRVTRLCQPSGSPSFWEQEPEWRADIGCPVELLTRIGRERARLVRVHIEYLSSMMGLVCCLSSALLTEPTLIVPYRRFVTLLATNLPQRISASELPLVAELLDRRAFPAAYRAWQKVRRADGEQKTLSMLECHHLWTALHRLRKQSPRLRAFISTLDAITLVFRFAMQDVARAEVAYSKQGKDLI